MKNLFEWLNTFGIYVDESAPPIVLLALYYLILSVFILLNVINIIYLLSLYIVTHEKFLSKIPVKYIYIHKFILFYKKIRISFIIYETILLLICLIIMISISYGLVSFYIHYK